MESSSLDLLHSLRNNQPLMVEQLHHFCQINSGTDNLAGLIQMTQCLQAAYAFIADDMEIKTLSPISTITMQGLPYEQICGNALLIRKRPHLKRRILLSGHMDTVYSINSPFQQLHYVSDNHLNGPGVADMKGGLIVMLHALSAFEMTQVSSQIGWDVLINADEEIGSPASSALFKDLANNYQAALVYEPAMTLTGTLAKNRKGSGKFTLVAQGKAAHAGRAFDEGRNAICYLAEAIIAINALNGQREGVTINIGKIAGGEALNVVPDKAVCKIDVRISQTEDACWVQKALQTVQKKLQRPDYSLMIHGDFGRPVKRVSPGTKRLFERIQTLGKSLGLTVDWKDSGGCCDGNNLAQLGLPVLDTLGVRGGNIHSADEFILLDSLPERAALSTLLLMDLAQGGLEDLTNDSTS